MPNPYEVCNFGLLEFRFRGAKQERMRRRREGKDGAVGICRSDRTVVGQSGTSTLQQLLHSTILYLELRGHNVHAHLCKDAVDKTPKRHTGRSERQRWTGKWRCESWRGWTPSQERCLNGRGGVEGKSEGRKSRGKGMLPCVVVGAAGWAAKEFVCAFHWPVAALTAAAGQGTLVGRTRLARGVKLSRKDGAADI